MKEIVYLIKNFFLEKNQIFLGIQYMNYFYHILITLLSRLEQVFLADYNGKLLYNFNPINSRIVKNFNIDVVTPLLNKNLISYGLKIPTKFKYDAI